MSERYRITDPRVLKAVAHPLRGHLLGLLRVEGPATATELARKVGESSGSTSYHLRELARYGFIEEDPERRDARERRWRARHRYTAWSNAELVGTPEGREAAAAMRRRQLDILARDHASFEREMDAWGAEWIDAAGMSDETVRLTPASVAEFHRRAMELARELAGRDAGDPSAEPVNVHLGVFPHRPSGGPLGPMTPPREPARTEQAPREPAKAGRPPGEPAAPGQTPHDPAGPEQAPHDPAEAERPPREPP
ncbi:helix-turn-helix domain-containing protein [Streptosporangium sp. V21-05]|uniref:winged helix-turn-helix domain-containing protein n=1 Tax=Streptosporangium sp. V21-05 TaxID=3446115 RepID=UPI003F53BACC